ncbi:SusD/RagB family nutrient-binding outer membrane lipoprotein [Filimonas effusa]|uniref:SusD/RagB family nutrient-binding outer membrane lipoprotein n=1 Tax=Filimonas effusa TaxID=2508721 RepID=A0A4Q1D8R4_9BACT|nr:SusD/RagB family nutrient-binding outer membrane lipoprotein [Filimonas effusa]RXK85600.1 SusD/RagB family nutrient-binding outer membrane lipoprotein [Filimonas effusa]
MKKGIVYIWITALAIGIAASSCTKDFADINTNPNASPHALPETLLSPALVSLVNSNLNRAMRISNDLMQVSVTVSESREFHRYVIRPTESDYMWSNWYVQLTNIRDIYTSASLTQQTGYQTYQGISLILDAWVTSMITDMYGDVPYTESNRGKEGIIQPKFDSQKDIYLDLFNKLDTANVLLAKNVDLPNATTADPLFAGSANKWRRFGNSLFLRLLMRASGKAESGAVAKIRKIVNEDAGNYPIMTGNEFSAVLPIGAATPLQSEFALYRDLDFSGGKGYSEFFINNLNAWIDPRLPKIATALGLGGGYLGITSGYGTGNAPEIMSTYLNTLKTDPHLGNIMNYAELQFILAEAAVRGYITGTPKTYYDNGVTNAITFWQATVPTGHLDKEDVKWNENVSQDEKIEQILLQKYYTLFFTDFQSWSEYRRTGHPVLPIGPGVQNGGKMPSRFVYPINTQATNPVHYREAANAMGGDNINAKVWWNKPD